VITTFALHATNLISMVQEKIEQSTDVLKAIISPVMQEGEEVMWPPRNPEALKLMEKVSISLFFSDCPFIECISKNTVNNNHQTILCHACLVLQSC
jgi:uncharacterized membrane protein YagU involved in acid resistance